MDILGLIASRGGDGDRRKYVAGGKNLDHLVYLKKVSGQVNSS